MKKTKLGRIALFLIKLFIFIAIIKLAFFAWKQCSPDSYREATFLLYSVEAFAFDSCANGFITDSFKDTEKVIFEYLTLDTDGYDVFTSNGGKIQVITPEEMTKFPDMPDGTVGIYGSYENTIYIADQANVRTYPVVLHELGHYIDSACGVLSMSPEFITIAQQEIYGFARSEDFTIGSTYVLEAYQGSRVFTEYFAETYMCYHAMPNYLKVAAPKTYEYFDNLHLN